MSDTHGGGGGPGGKARRRAGGQAPPPGRPRRGTGPGRGRLTLVGALAAPPWETEGRGKKGRDGRGDYGEGGAGLSSSNSLK